MKPTLTTLSGIVLLLSLLLVGGCTALTTTPAASPVPAATIPPTTAPATTAAAATVTSAPPTATPMPTVPSATATATPPAGEPLTLASIHMLTATEGWATGSTVPSGGVAQPAPSNNVFRTSDGGASWQDVTPSDVVSQTVASTYFLDTSHAWAASPASTDSAPAPTTFTVYGTQDGGQTWRQSEPIATSGGGPGQIDFVDAQHGWLMVTLGAGMMHQALAIYSTADAGMHWQQVALTSGTEGESTPGSLPFVCDKSGITFSDTSTGWAGGACPGAPLFFYVTHDAGQTWEPVTLPAPAGYPADLYAQCQCAVSRPTFVTPQVGFVTIQIYEQQPSAALYVTEDGGATWTARELPVTQLAGGSPDFVDANTGWLTDGQQLYATHDAGQTWSAVGTLPLPGEDLRSLDFADADNGWLLGQQLYITRDGGRSWSAISPVVTAGPTGETTPTVTLADDGTTLHLQAGERFLLKLGEDYDWTVTVADQSVVSRVVNIMVVRGAQGVYEAHQAGSTTLTAAGDPVCRQAQPPCAAPSRDFRLEIVVSATAPMPTGQTSYTDPFAYCAAVGTVDAPGPRYAGPQMPESVAQGLQTALDVPNTPLDVLANGSSWRCMDGQVYACFVGANLPCDAKANTDRTPTQAEEDFCQQQPDADVIPAFVTGHDTVYAWRCTNGTAEIVKQVFQVDAQGYIADIWYAIQPSNQ